MAGERRVFSEQEVTAVVRRAVQLQEQAGKETYTPGVTSDELEKIAGELGIDPKYLQQAIDEANTETRHGVFNLNEEFERVIDTELAPEDYDVLLNHLRAIGHRHPISQVGRTLTGSTWTGRSLANVEVTSKRGRTRIRVRSNSLFAFLVTVYPAFLATIFLLGPLSSAGLVWLGLLLAACAWIIAAMCFKGLAKTGHSAARKLTDRLAQAVAEEAAESTRDRLAHSSPAETTTEEHLQARG